MNLAEIQDEVYSLTNRPDLVSDTLVAIRAATLKMHHVDTFYKDLKQALLNLSSADYVGTFETTLLTRYRGMAFIRPWYPTGINVQTQMPTGKPGKPLDCVVFDSVLDSYGRDRKNIYYIAGRQVNIKIADQLGTFLVGWYAHPNITVAAYESWIAEEHPYAIVYDAAATVFKTIGYDEQSTRYGNMVGEQIAMLKLSNIEAELR